MKFMKAYFESLKFLIYVKDTPTLISCDIFLNIDDTCLLYQRKEIWIPNEISVICVINLLQSNYVEKERTKVFY